MKKSIIILSMFAAVALLLFVGIQQGCKKSSDNSTPGPNEVWMQNMAFTPTSISVAVNTTITWTNKDNMVHTVSSDSLLWDSGSVNGGGTFSRKFTTAGTFPYHCNVHANMHATVIVHN